MCTIEVRNFMYYQKILARKGKLSMRMEVK